MTWEELIEGEYYKMDHYGRGCDSENYMVFQKIGRSGIVIEPSQQGFYADVAFKWNNQIYAKASAQDIADYIASVEADKFVKGIVKGGAINSYNLY